MRHTTGSRFAVFLFAAATVFCGVSARAPAAFSQETDSAQPRAPEAIDRQALKSITARELLAHVAYLASDDLRGREAGTKGGAMASAYIAARFKELGLEPLGDDGGFFQNFTSLGGIKCRNVVALLRGSDEKLKNEYVVMGAHHDHVGMGTTLEAMDSTPWMNGRGKVHNGADDNASGVSMVLELAEAFTKMKPAPRRSLVFATFDDEEPLVMGSRRYVRRPPVPLKDTVFMLNCDMVGRAVNHRVEAYGAPTGAGLREIIDRYEPASGLTIVHRDVMPENSDHFRFYSKGVPVLFLMTDMHGDYHRATDDVEKINSADMQRIGRLALRVTNDIANRPARLKFRKMRKTTMLGGLSLAETLRLFLPRPAGKPYRPRFGGMPFDEGGGVVIGGIVPSTPADRAGLREDDRVLRFNGKPVPTTKALMKFVRETGDGAAELEVQRGGEKLVLRVVFEETTRERRGYSGAGGDVPGADPGEEF